MTSKKHLFPEYHFKCSAGYWCDQTKATEWGHEFTLDTFQFRHDIDLRSKYSIFIIF